MKTFGLAGAGIFPAPTVIERQVCEQYGVAVVGRIDAVREQFYAISIDRRLKHPAVVAVFEAARRELFS
jgi:LysR family transcriptional activator of nhaA